NVSSQQVYYWRHRLEIKSAQPIYGKIDIPSKEELEDLYINKQMNKLQISKYYKEKGTNVSNVTVGKWLKQYQIQERSHQDTIKLTAPQAKQTFIKKIEAGYIPKHPQRSSLV